MTINRISISSQSIKENTEAVIEIKTTQPSTIDTLAQAETPGKLIGYYDAISDRVNLYVVDRSGFRLLRC